jgi:hypothetical protein
MRRALREGGRVAVAVWAALDRCTPYHAIHQALRATVPRDLSDTLLAPFAWNDPVEIDRALVDAGFRDVHVEVAALPLVFEEGIDQAIAAVFASPLGPGITALPAAQREAFFAAARERLSPLLAGDGAVRGELASVLALGRR